MSPGVQFYLSPDTKARLLLMACLMKFGSLPPAANPDQRTAEETAAVREKVATYQTVFNPLSFFVVDIG